MNKAIKWALITGGCLIVMVMAALLIIPKLVNIQKYKPLIEKQVTQTTGRSFTLGGDLRLTLFPWASLSFSDLHFGNPPGFAEKDFITVESFDVRVKLLPLLFKDVQVKRFILKGIRVVLETRKNGNVNWDFSKKAGGGIAQKIPEETKKQATTKPIKGLDLKALAVSEFTVTDGSVIWLDHKKKERKEISDLTLLLKDISLDRPVHLSFSARLDKMPVSLEGQLGTLAEAMRQGTIDLDLSAKALDQLDLKFKGKVANIMSHPNVDLAVKLSSFSPRRLLTSMGKPLPINTTDPKVLNLAALSAGIRGDSKSISITDGLINIDDSKINFYVNAADFSRPAITFDLNLDQIDLDRYLPPPSEKKPGTKHPDAKTSTSERQPIDYSPLRRLVLDGSARVGKLKVKKAQLEKVILKIRGENGVFDLEPLSMALYQGSLQGKGTMNVRTNVPDTAFNLNAKSIQAGPMINDVLEKDFIEGTLQARVGIKMKGDNPEKIKKTLSGNGDFFFKDGAIKGIDLASMVRNVQIAFGLAEKGQEKPRTDFSELHAPFVIKNGTVETPKTTLTSPLLRVLAKGTADLVTEGIDVRVEPKFVATIKGQGDTKDRSGVTVPVLITGTFTSPKFRPDLEGILKQTIEKKIPELQKQLLEDGAKKKGLKSGEKQLKDLLKSFGQ